MQHIFNWFNRKLKLRKLYLRIISSIAFIPGTIAFLLFALALLLMYLDTTDISYKLIETIPFLVTRNPDTARSVLSTLATGMISLMVFSFTMVMLVLTIVTNNYTPRVLPGLISIRSHQVVLGLYLGTIAYTVVVLLNVDSERYNFEVPEISIVFNVLLVFICLIAFIHFIHSISQKIQIGNILETIFRKTRKLILEESKREHVPLPSEAAGWLTIFSPKSGYYQGSNEKALAEIATKHNFQLVIAAEAGEFLLEGAPFLKYNKPLSSRVIEDILEQVDFYQQEHLEVSYLYGFKHMTEIALRSLSPGINDSGTAIKAIEYLTQLYVDLISIENFRCRRDSYGYPRIYSFKALFETVFYFSFSEIKNFSSSSVVVQQKLLETLQLLDKTEGGKKYGWLFSQERESLIENAKNVLKNTNDQVQLQRNEQE